MYPDEYTHGLHAGALPEDVTFTEDDIAAPPLPADSAGESAPPLPSEDAPPLPQAAVEVRSKEELSADFMDLLAEKGVSPQSQDTIKHPFLVSQGG